MQLGATAPSWGASNLEQLQNKLASLEVAVSVAQLERLSEVSVLDLAHFKQSMLKRVVFAGASVEGWR